jgi:NADH-quinone oxidoreductase subunit D
MSGEEVLYCDPQIGYLHRSVEKVVENKKYLSIIPYIDRLDYLSPLIQEHAYVMSLERALNITPPKRAVLIRTIFDELTRISSHIMGIGSATYDIGCLSIFLYGFEEREKIMDIFELTTGARMHLAYFVPGGVLGDISNETIDRIYDFVNGLNFYLDAVEKIALNNRIFKKRTKGIGVISKELAIKGGISGANLRASGIPYDVRKSRAYAAYESIRFNPIVLREGDSYSRTKLRFLEIKQSIELIKETLKLIGPGEICNYGYFSSIQKRGTLEELLHDGFFTIGIELPKNTIIYSSTETPRGEYGIHMFVGDDQNKPYRMRFKSPSFMSIQLLKELLIGVKLADIPVILGSLDFIMGDCDR